MAVPLQSKNTMHCRMRRDGDFRIRAVMTALYLGLVVAAAADPAPVYFPLEKGNYWIYRGETKWVEQAQPPGKNIVRTAVLTWKMEVIETGEGNGVFAALLKGYPGDLGWYEAGKQRGDWLIVRTSAGTFYLLEGKQARKTWDELRTDAGALKNATKDAEPILETPLAQGKTFGGDPDMRPELKAQGRYCWFVAGDRNFNPKRFSKAPVIRPARDFTLLYRTNPDTTTLDFVPGIGIVGYQYVHHGTTAETDLGLIEFGTAATR